MTAPQWLGIAAGALLSAGAHADSTVKLYCASRATGFADAEMQVRERGTSFVNVTFSRTMPTKRTVDWALRDCLSTAIKLDATQDIVALAWYRRHSRAALEPLEAYAGDVKVFYSAQRHAVLLRKVVSSR
jgi:hypothetical protein